MTKYIEMQLHDSGGKSYSVFYPVVGVKVTEIDIILYLKYHDGVVDTMEIPHKMSYEKACRYIKNRYLCFNYRHFNIHTEQQIKDELAEWARGY